MNFQITCVVLIAILNGACRKDSRPLYDGVSCTDECFSITGKVFDSANNNALPNSLVKFFYKTVNASLLSNNTSFIGETRTDQEGKYSIIFPGENLSKTLGYYYAEVFKDDLFYDPFYKNRFPAFNLDSSLFNTTQKQDFPLFRPATLKVRVIASQTINYQYLTISYSYGKMSNSVIVNGPGKIDKVFTFKTAGDIRTVVTTDMTGNGLFIVQSDTVIVESGKIRQIEVRF